MMRITNFADAYARSASNIKLLLLVASSALVFSQGWLASWGLEQTEPLYQLTGYSLSEHSSHVIFGIFGFLSLSCLEESSDKTALSFTLLLRLLAGLGVAVVVLFVFVGPWLAHQPLAYYLQEPEVWRSLVRILLAFDASATLPYAFDSNMVAGVAMLNLPLMGTAIILWSALAGAVILRPGKGGDFALAALITCTALCVFMAERKDIALANPALANLVQLGMCYALGAVLWNLRHWLKPDPILIVALWAVVILLATTSAFLPLLILASVFTSIAAALAIPALAAEFFGEIDLSYGVLLYGWPIQQILERCHPFIAPHMLALESLCFALALAVLSWRLIEMPASGYGFHFANALRQRADQPTLTCH